MSDTLVNALKLIKALHDKPECGALFVQFNQSVREQVLLAPKTLEQLTAAIDVAEKRAVEPEYVSVIVVRNDVVDQNYLFVGPSRIIAASAEEKFKELVKGEGLEPDDLEAVLEDGYWEFKDGNGSVCINWPERLAATTLGRGLNVK